MTAKKGPTKMEKYPKIVTVWERDPERRYKYLVQGKWARPELEYLKDNQWVFTEKVDGTNIRLIWDGQALMFAGRTDKAIIPPFLKERLLDLLVPVPVEGSLAELFTPDNTVCLYGEGYGARIQKAGKHYKSGGVDFILFDIMVNGLWLEREDVVDIADKLTVDVVPVVGTGTLETAINLVGTGFHSEVAEEEITAEGLVMRPKIELSDRRGNRIITKIKYKDFER